MHLITKSTISKSFVIIIAGGVLTLLAYVNAGVATATISAVAATMVKISLSRAPAKRKRTAGTIKKQSARCRCGARAGRVAVKSKR